MRKIYLTLIVALLAQGSVLAQGWPANYGGVMLQGFFWDSYKEKPDCSPFGPVDYQEQNKDNAVHQPGYTWATMYGAGWTTGEEWQVPITTWTSLLAHKDDITPYIDLLWLPQSGSTIAPATTTYYTSNDNSGRGGVRPWRNGLNWGYTDGMIITNPDCMGFVPVFYFHHGMTFNDDNTPWTYNYNGETLTPMSYFGTEPELRNLIKTFKDEGTGAIEDVVANHRGGLGTWSNDKNSIEFPTEYYKGTFCPEGENITWDRTDVCSDDESGRGAGNPDCGGKGEWARDIDHHSPVTQQKVLKFLDYLKNDLGYVGYRYDYAMGFEEKHFAEYNTILRPTFSVGEYWGSKENISSWIHRTYMEGTYQSAAFDFPLQSDIREAFNYGNYRYLNNSGLISDPVLKRYAVTFLDNHDTFKDLPTDGSNYNWGSGKAYNHRVEKNIVEANAFILAMPGTPCLFYPHFMHPQWHDILCLLIKARRTAGITNESERSAAVLKGNNGIQWVVTGNNGQVCYQLGDAVSEGVPEGFTTVWESDPDQYGYKVARYSITSSLYDQVATNTKKPLINGYPVINRNSGTFSGSITVNVKPSSEGCTLVYTTNGNDPQAGDAQITNATNLTISETTTLKVGVLVGGAVLKSSIVTRQYLKTNNTSNEINFYVKDDNTPHIYTYYYDDNGTLHEPCNQWPGAYASDKVQVGGLDWWHVKISRQEKPVSLIINWDGSQTPDIDGIDSDVFYTVQNGQPNDVTTTYLPILENPDLSIDKPTGTYQGGVTATISASYSGATIVYTTDGTEPTITSQTINSGESITFNTTGNHYLRAGIVKDGEVIKQVARSYYVENGSTESGVNIFVRNMTTSDAPHILAWKDEQSLTTPFAQGGETLTETVTNCGQTWYKKHFDDVPSGVLFLLSGAENQPSKDQTSDITGFEAGKDYYFYYYPGARFGSNYQDGYIEVTNDSKHTTDIKAITVYMYSNQWSDNLKFYPFADSKDLFWNWAGSWAESAFPSVTLNNQKWYYCTILGHETIGTIVYNGSNDSERYENRNITSDIFIRFPSSGDNNGNVWYYWGNGDDLTSSYKGLLPEVQTPTLDVIPSCATAMSDCLYFYFENGSFGSPFAWVYSNTKTFSDHGWPGKALVEVVGTAPSGNLVYRWTYSDTSSQPSDVIFSNNGQSQVGPFKFENGAYYTSAGKIGVAHDDIKTLAEVLKTGTKDQSYIISNDILAVFGKDDRIFAKDADGDALNISLNTDNKKIHKVYQEWTYDQSNWIEIVLPEELTGSKDISLLDNNLLGQTIVGQLVDKDNPKIKVVAYPIPTSKQETFTPNNYTAANFMPAEVNADYFLVAPQPQEYAIINFAKYNGDGTFIVPETNLAGTQSVDLTGRVALAVEQPYFDGQGALNEIFQDGEYYKLTVIVKRKGSAQGAPMLMDAGDVSTGWQIAIVEAEQLDSDPTTAISDVNVDSGKELVNVRYYNLMGVESKTPFEGVNIVVRDYSDGSRTTTKVLKR